MLSDRDRLIEFLKKADENASKKLIMDYDDAIADNADYLLANGVIVPPCKVGAIVYVIYPDPRYNWGNKELKILELKVHAFRYFNNKATVEIRGDGNYITWDISCFGVSVFLTP